MADHAVEGARARPGTPPGRSRRPHPRLAAVLGLLGALHVALLALGPAAHATTEGCTPGADTGCITGTIRTSAGEPAEGVELEVSGPGGTQTVATDASGRWTAAVEAAGDYTVTLDVETLPEGEQLRSPGDNPRTVAVTLGANSGALFPLGTPPPGPDPAGDGDPDDPTEPSTGEPGLDTAPQGSTGGGFSWERLAGQVSSGLVFGVLLALASVGLSLIFGTTGLSNFAHGEQVTLGAILAFVLTQTVGLPLLVSATLAVLLAAGSGWLQDAAIWRPLRRMRVGLTQQLIVTIGLAITLQYVFQFFLGGGSLRIVRRNPRLVDLGPISVSQTSLVSLAIALAVLGLVGWVLVGTRVGRATRAVSDNPALAAASGIAVDRIIRLVWTVGAGLAGLGGVLMGLYLNATAWNMGSTLLLLMFAAVTLGGLGTAFGAFAGSIVIGLVVELSTLVIPLDMRYAGALVILILVLLLRPQGILGRAERIG